MAAQCRQHLDRRHLAKRRNGQQQTLEETNFAYVRDGDSCFLEWDGSTTDQCSSASLPQIDAWSTGWALLKIRLEEKNAYSVMLSPWDRIKQPYTQCLRRCSPCTRVRRTRRRWKKVCTNSHKSLYLRLLFSTRPLAKLKPLRMHISRFLPLWNEQRNIFTDITKGVISVKRLEV